MKKTQPTPIPGCGSAVCPKRKELLEACKVVEAAARDIGALGRLISISFVDGRVLLDGPADPPDEDISIDAPDLFTALRLAKGGP